MRHQTRKLTVTVQLELDQLERLTAVARREGLNRSIIVRQALERELARYERADRKKGDGPAATNARRPVVPETAASRA